MNGGLRAWRQRQSACEAEEDATFLAEWRSSQAAGSSAGTAQQPGSGSAAGGAVGSSSAAGLGATDDYVDDIVYVGPRPPWMVRLAEAAAASGGASGSGHAAPAVGAAAPAPPRVPLVAPMAMWVGEPAEEEDEDEAAALLQLVGAPKVIHCSPATSRRSSTSCQVLGDPVLAGVFGGELRVVASVPPSAGWAPGSLSIGLRGCESEPLVDLTCGQGGHHRVSAEKLLYPCAEYDVAWTHRRIDPVEHPAVLATCPLPGYEAMVARIACLDLDATWCVELPKHPFHAAVHTALSLGPSAAFACCHDAPETPVRGSAAGGKKVTRALLQSAVDMRALMVTWR